MKLQKDNSGDTGCMNLDCEGFRLVSGSPIFPGDIIQPVSDIKGVRQNITIKVFKVCVAPSVSIH
jgi:hypothetical protein